MPRPTPKGRPPRLPLDGLVVGGLELFSPEAEASRAVALAAGQAAPLPTQIEIMLEGQYATRDLTITPRMFDEIMSNHRNARVDPALDFEHESWFSWDATPAKGWMRELRVAPSTHDVQRKALVGTPDFNDLGAPAVANQHYRYTSAGLLKNDSDRMTGQKIGAVLDHVALCKNPFIQGMAPLSLSNFPGLGRADGEIDMNELVEFLKKSLGLADADEAAILARARQLESGIVSLSRGGAIASSEFVVVLGLEGKPLDKAAAEGLKAALDKTGKELADLKAKAIVADVDGAIAAKLFTPAEREEQIKLATDNRALYDSLKSKRTPIALGGEKIKTAADAPREGAARLEAQDKAIREHMAANKCDYGTALTALSQLKPELFSGEGV